MNNGFILVWTEKEKDWNAGGEKLTDHYSYYATKKNANTAYKRLLDMTGHWSKMGKSLAQAVESYNKAVGSLETRVLVTARKFKDLQLLSEEVNLELLAEIDKKPRDLQIAELVTKSSNKDQDCTAKEELKTLH